MNKKDTFSPVYQTAPEIKVSTFRLMIPVDKSVLFSETITKDQIAGIQSSTTADLLGKAGNIFVQKSQQGGGSPVLRGFEANRVLLMVDGVRMNNLIFRGGHLQNCITTDDQSMDHIDVIYGPGSSMYGSDALGGVVNMFTLQPRFSTNQKTYFEPTFSTRYGSAANEFNEHAGWRIASQKWALVSSITYRSFGDLMSGKSNNPFYVSNYGLRNIYVSRINRKDTMIENKNPYRQVYSGYQQFDLVEKLAFKTGKNLLHELNVQYSTSSDVPRYDRLTDKSGDYPIYARWDYGPQKRFMAAHTLKSNQSSWFADEWHSVLAYQNFEESRITRKFRNDLEQTRTENVNVISLNVDFKKASPIKHYDLHWSDLPINEWHYGVEVVWNGLQSTATGKNIITGSLAPISSRYPNGKNQMSQFALYVSHLKEKNKWILNEGLRVGYASLHSTIADNSFFQLPYDEVRQKNRIVSGNWGATYKIKKGWRGTVLLSSGYRVPNVDDLSKIFESRPGILIVPNSNLKPEQTINYEIGIQKISDRLNWNTRLYYTRFFNAIVTQLFTFNEKDSILYDGTLSRVYANQNNRKAFITGFQSKLNYAFNNRWTYLLNLNYTYGRILTDSVNQPLDHIPPFMLFNRISYKQKQFEAALTITYNSWKRISNYLLNGEDNEAYATPDGMPAWIRADIQCSYKLGKLWCATISLENILDTQYRTFASGINAPGRNFTVGLRWEGGKIQ